jgi:hypothetical protein
VPPQVSRASAYTRFGTARGWRSDYRCGEACWRPSRRGSEDLRARHPRGRTPRDRVP